MLNHERFKNDHTYHLFLQKSTLPYSQQYYDILKHFLEHNNPTNVIFESFFGKLFCFVENDQRAFEKINYFLNKFDNIVVDHDMFNKIFKSLKGEREMWPDDIEAGYVTMWKNPYVIQRMIYILYKLCLNMKLKITLDNLYEHINKINWKFQLIQTLKMLKKIFEKIYICNTNQHIKIQTLDYIFKYGLIKKFNITEQYQYEILYKYYVIPKQLDDKFKFTIKCLENACGVKNNVETVKKLLQFIKPNSNCLDNALKFKSNDVVKLLITQIKPTKSQIIQYCKKYNDDILLYLFEYC